MEAFMKRFNFLLLEERIVLDGALAVTVFEGSNENEYSPIDAKLSMGEHTQMGKVSTNEGSSFDYFPVLFKNLVKHAYPQSFEFSEISNDKTPSSSPVLHVTNIIESANSKIIPTSPWDSDSFPNETELEIPNTEMPATPSKDAIILT